MKGDGRFSIDLDADLNTVAHLQALLCPDVAITARSKRYWCHPETAVFLIKHVSSLFLLVMFSVGVGHMLSLK